MVVLPQCFAAGHGHTQASNITFQMHAPPPTSPCQETARVREAAAGEVMASTLAEHFSHSKLTASTFPALLKFAGIASLQFYKKEDRPWGLQ